MKNSCINDVLIITQNPESSKSSLKSFTTKKFCTSRNIINELTRQPLPQNCTSIRNKQLLLLEYMLLKLNYKNEKCYEKKM